MASTTMTKFAHLQIPLEDVVKATRNFHVDNIIGHGGLGSIYQGQLLRSGKLMKIAALKLDHKQGVGYLEFWTEISVLSDLKHTNLISIIGFCDEKHEKIIIFTRVAKGSLKEHLNSPNLTWTQRLRICVGVARAVSYLHHEEGRGYGVIHRNINSSTVLLDENWEAKLSGFKVSIKQSVNLILDHVILSEPLGTTGYMDPEIEKTGGVTHKSDIYALGVVLFEILCGRRAYIMSETYGSLTELVKHHYENGTMLNIIHPPVLNQLSPSSLVTFSDVAYSCLEEERIHRPDASNIVEELEKALKFQLRLENLIKNLENLKIPLHDIKLATHNFSETYAFEFLDNYIWYRAELNHFDKEKPSFVETKSKGELPKRHNSVAIKRFFLRNKEQGEEFYCTELEMLSSAKHHNILTLIGFCIEGFEMVLVIENASNEYLNYCLGNVEKMRELTWQKRLKICIDVAHALDYLHFKMGYKKGIIHGSIASHSIGLDENWRAKIGMFEHAAFLPANQEDKAPSTKLFYSKYYVDPEYVKEFVNTGKLKRESDVYSFGIVLFEILCGRKVNDPVYLKESDEGLAFLARRSFCTITLEDIVDPIIKGETMENNYILNRGPNKDSFDTFCKIAYKCVAETQDQRPTMKMVVKELEKALFFQENNMIMSHEDVKQATQNFDDDNCIGGEGSFGKVYKGKVPQGDGFYTVVAKRLDTRFSQGEQQFFNEIQILLEYKHENIIGLVGYCDEKDEKLIVYEYASSSLDRCLNDASLTWMKRLNICIDVASALDFLHEGVGREAKMIHRDIKTTNILLNDDWKAKLAGFGLTLMSPLNQERNYDNVCGTPGYLDPLWIKTGFLTKESDIYSFGVVLFEVLCGRSTLAIHKHEGQHLPDYIRNNFEEGKHDEVVFEQIKEQIVPKSLVTFQTIAYQCLHHEREERPTTKEVLMQLKKALEFQEGKIQGSSMDQVVNKVENLHLTREILETKFEHFKIRFSEIQSGTDNFSHTHIIATRDAYTLYRAELNCFGKENPPSIEGERRKGQKNVVIIRYTSLHGVYGEKQFFTEIEMLTAVEHDNIVTLLGFCVETRELILVTEYVSFGYLGNFLENDNDKRFLTWEIRLKISAAVAHALNYLHYEIEEQKVIINRNVSSFNIGLDENQGAKIFDFGLSIFLPPNQKDEAFYPNTCSGTRAYMDPEYNETGRLKRESDVYSFGVVLFEILCGRRAFDPIYDTETDKWLASAARQSYRMGTLDDMIDPIIKEETCENDFILNKGPNKDSLHTYIEIAYKCVAETQDERPTMKVVMQELVKALSLQQTNKDKLRISLEDIKLATGNFDKDNYIGEGGFGNVYKGNLQDGDEFKTIVAKRLDTKHGQGEKQFLSELQILWEYKHRDIVGLVGYCDEKYEKIIVYEYASRGSLDRHLNNACLTWIKRLSICIDVARALDFLHGGDGKQAKVIHRDIKTANILLNVDWKAKLGDFGLSLISPLTKETDYVIDYVCGTTGYLDPLYGKSGFLTIESDIYSFGVVLFEILWGKSTFEVLTSKHCYLQDFIKNNLEEGKHNEMVFGKIREQIEPKSLSTFQKIAYQCLHDEREKRPTSKEVLRELKKAMEFQISRSDASTTSIFCPEQD